MLKKTLPLLLIIFLTTSFAWAQDELRIDITQGRIDPHPIAIPSLISSDSQSRRIARDIKKVIENDLLSTKLFRIIDEKAHIERLTDMNIPPRFGDWKKINTKILLQGQVAQSGNNIVEVSVRLWDITRSQQLFARKLSVDAKNWRRLGHSIADIIYERLTGDKGYFDTRIVYIAESGSKANRSKRLAIMDQDGANHKYLTDGKRLVLTPRFAPNLSVIAYLAYPENGKPQVLLHNMQSGQSQNIGTFEGMQFAPRFSYDGKKLIMSLEQNGNSDIFEMDIATRQMKRLTTERSIDTSPSYSPDGKYIVFNSDRGGSSQLYIMDRDGKNVRRLSYGKGRYSTPVWSPRGDLIAFTKSNNNQFFIGVMQPDGKGERTVSSAWLVEGPTWAPNGRVLMFGHQSAPNAKMTIFSIDLTGYNFRPVPTPGEASDPAWSPIIR